MKLIYMFFIALLFLAINGCVSTLKTNKVMSDASKKYAISPIKNPIAVTLYTGKQKPEKPYIVLEHQTVSKYNIVGIKRQEANIKDSIRRLAAKKGGDAVIEITNYPDSISYTVISYQNVSTDSIKT